MRAITIPESSRQITWPKSPVDIDTPARGSYRRRVTAWTRRGLALGAALILAGIGLGLGGPGPRAARADGIMLIQAGAFWMGSDDGDPDERPLHRVFVRDFWLDRHKVTNREVALFLEARGLRSAEGMDYFDAADPDARIHRRDGRFTADPGFEDHPAVEVSWYGARDYCLWQGKRLPSEAEWEKAARGTDRRRYPWGDGPPGPEHAVFGRPYNATERGDRRPAGDRTDRCPGSSRQPAGVDGLRVPPLPLPPGRRPRGGRPPRGPRGARRQPRRSPGDVAGDDPALLLV